MKNSSSSILPLIDNENKFLQIRKQLISKTTKSASTGKNFLTCNNKIKVLSKEVTPENPLIVHYTYENRLKTFKTEFHTIWSETFNNTPLIDLKVIVGNRISSNSTKELVQTNPNRN